MKRNKDDTLNTFNNNIFPTNVIVQETLEIIQS